MKILTHRRVIRDAIVNNFINKILTNNKMRIGKYAEEYNSKLHGPYDPTRYYGKKKYN